MTFPFFAPRRLLTGALLLAAVGCRGYEPGFRYEPSSEVHAIHLQADKTSEARARVGARIVGVLRAEEALPRRLHARLEVENPGGGAVTLLTSETRATPGGTAALVPFGATSDVTAGAGERRMADLFFALPADNSLPDSAFDEVELTWTLDLDGTKNTSRATFRRRYLEPDPWLYDPWYGGSWYGGPWCGGPWYGGPWHAWGGTCWHQH